MEEDINCTVKKLSEKYNTANPFTLADKMNVEVDWVNFGNYPLGKTIYDGKSPVVMLNDRIRDLPVKYFALSHELGHCELHEGLVAYYTTFRFDHSKLENEADKFAIDLLKEFYEEENGTPAANWNDLVSCYGFPEE